MATTTQTSLPASSMNLTPPPSDEVCIQICMYLCAIGENAHQLYARFLVVLMHSIFCDHFIYVHENIFLIGSGWR